MIEISVTGLQKSFDLEKKILDGLTFQINSGERVGLLGKNGAGKTTLFRILTGEIDYDAGEVAIASDRRVGLISQIPVYPAGYTVEDVLQSAFERMRRMADEMERLSAQMANGDESEETLRRYGELSARFEGLGGYDTATAVNKVANGLSISAAMRDTSMILCLVCSPPPAESSGSSSGNSARPFARIDTQPRLSLETYRFFVSGRKA